ncbi:hypothetical protein ACT691_02190 [Vibrio metschnikovii]
MQLKPLLALIPLLLTSATQAETAAPSETDETITVHGQPIPTHQRLRSDLDKMRGIANADIFSGITSIQSNNMHNEAGALDIGIRGLQGEGRVPILLMAACNLLTPLVVTKASVTELILILTYSAP